MLQILFALSFCFIYYSHSVEFEKSTNLTKPEIRSLGNAVIGILEKSDGYRYQPKDFGKKLYQDFFRELLTDSYNGNACKESGKQYFTVRGALSGQLLNPRTYKDFSVISTSPNKKQPLLYLPLLAKSIPSSQDIRYVENPLPSSENIENHNLEYINRCVDADDPSTFESRFYDIFQIYVLRILPYQLGKVFTVVLRERSKFKDLYKLMKSLSKNKIENPPKQGDIIKVIQTALDDIAAIKQLGQVNSKCFFFLCQIFVMQSFQLLN